MQPLGSSTTWDFSPVHQLLQAFAQASDYSPSETTDGPKLLNREDPKSDEAGVGASAGGLGDFNRIWDFLGVQRNEPAQSVPTFEASIAAQLDNKDAYASDGTLYYPPSSKHVGWREDQDGPDVAETQPEDSPPSGPVSGTKKLTKGQRKKANRKARRELQLKSHAEHLEKNRQKAKQFESEDDFDNTSTAKYNETREHDVEGEDDTSEENRAPSKSPVTPKRDEQKKDERKLEPDKIPDSIDELTEDVQNSLLKNTTTPARKLNPYITVQGAKPTPGTTDPATFQNAVDSVQESLKNQWPVADPFTARINSLTTNPTSMPGSESRVNGKGHGRGLSAACHLETQTPTRKRHDISPLVHQSSTARHWSLLLKLLHRFPQDRKTLLSPLQLSINRPQPSGIHVFVDASNILIGFQDKLKRDRNIPITARISRVDLNFHALALFLERRRPVAKRVLAGSAPEIPAFEEARQVGYETCILDKVWKAKELTERQRKNATKSLQRMSAFSYANGYHAGASGSESAGNGDPATGPKWVEQAVDEVLHLKILESIVDAPSPPQQTDESLPARPTMVLATGDAAEAEYSSGFMKMVERALRNGWNVEVVAWGHSVSWSYRRMEKTPAKGGGWGERFRIIELDDFAEELFGDGAAVD